MARNPFSKTNEFVAKPKRHTYDLSFQNNATFNFGTLYPVMCKEVMPGDSYRITPTFALRFMPMVFPVQTRMNANLHFFYVRTRNLWKDWPDFIAKAKDGLTPPYIECLNTDSDKFDKMFSTGSLGDYLGLPSTNIGDGYGSNTLGAVSAWACDLFPFFSYHADMPAVVNRSTLVDSFSHIYRYAEYTDSSMNNFPNIYGIDNPLPENGDYDVSEEFFKIVTDDEKARNFSLFKVGQFLGSDLQSILVVTGG